MKKIITSIFLLSLSLTVLGQHITINQVNGLQPALNGKTPTTRAITLNGITQDLSADRNFLVSGSGNINIPYASLTAGATTYTNTAIKGSNYQLFKNSTSKFLVAGTDYTVTGTGGFVLTTALISTDFIVLSALSSITSNEYAAVQAAYQVKATNPEVPPAHIEQSITTNSGFTTHTPTSNYPLKSCWLIIDSANATVPFNATPKNLYVYLNNAEVGRTVNWALFRKSGTSYTCTYVSPSVPATTAGLNTYTPTIGVMNINANTDYWGVYVNCVSTSNSIKMYSTGSTPISSTLRIDALPVVNTAYAAGTNATAEGTNYLFGIGAQFIDNNFAMSWHWAGQPNGIAPLDSTGKVPAANIAFSQKLIPLDYVNPATYSRKTNDLSTFVTNGNYPVTGYTFIPIDTASQVKVNGYLGSFRVNLTNAEVGRKVRFYVLRQLTAGNYTVMYDTGDIPAQLAGYNTATAPLFQVLVGDVIGCYINNISSANGIQYLNATGFVIASSLNNSGPLTLNNVYTGTAELPQRRFPIEATIFDATLMLPRQYGDKANGYPRIDVAGNLADSSVTYAMNGLHRKKAQYFGTSLPATSDSSIPGITGMAYPNIYAKFSSVSMDNEAVGSSGAIAGINSISLMSTKAELTAAYGAADTIYSWQAKIKKADIYFWEHGFNDRNSLATKLGTLDNTSGSFLDRTTYYGSFNQWYKDIIALNVNAIIVIVNPYSEYIGCTAKSSFASTKALNDAFINANAAIANFYNIPLINLYQYTGINILNQDAMSRDGIHMRPGIKPLIGSILYNRLLAIQAITPDLVLNTLGVSSGFLQPAFSAGIYQYYASITAATLTLTPTGIDAATTITIDLNGTGTQTVASGAASTPITLATGTNTINIYVTQGALAGHYTLIVTH